MILVPFSVPVTMIAEALREIFYSFEDSARSRISYVCFSRVALFWSVFGCSFETSMVLLLAPTDANVLAQFEKHARHVGKYALRSNGLHGLQLS